MRLLSSLSFLLVTTFSLSGFGQNQFQIKDENLFYAHKEACLVDVLADISIQLFGKVNDTSKIVNKYSHKLKLEDGKRKMQLTSRYHYSLYGAAQNVREVKIKINNPKYFQSKPKIAQKVTTLYLYDFPSVNINNVKQKVIYDDLGNAIDTEFAPFVVINPGNFPVGTVGTAPSYNANNVVGNITYDKQGYLSCIRSF